MLETVLQRYRLAQSTDQESRRVNLIGDGQNCSPLRTDEVGMANSIC